MRHGSCPKHNFRHSERERERNLWFWTYDEPKVAIPAHCFLVAFLLQVQWPLFKGTTFQKLQNSLPGCSKSFLLISSQVGSILHWCLNLQWNLWWGTSVWWVVRDALWAFALMQQLGKHHIPIILFDMVTNSQGPGISMKYGVSKSVAGFLAAPPHTLRFYFKRVANS